MEGPLGRFREYLLGERGLTAGTARGYLDCVRPFVITRVRGDVVDLAGISAVGILVAAVGRPELIQASWIKPGAVVIAAESSH